MACRKGITLTELMVVLGIMAVITGLLVVAVMRLRSVAARTESLNNMKQICLAQMNLTTSQGSRLPSISGEIGGDNPGTSVFGALLPYMEGADPILKQLNSYPGDFYLVRAFVSPADPTIGDAMSSLAEVSSYSANAQVFQANRRFPNSIPDGASNTIGFAEHYAFNCGGTSFLTFLTSPGIGNVWHRPTFADLLDITPADNESSLTFQAAPRIKDCFPLIPQTPHREGMVTGMMDGSARILSPSISPRTFWSAVSPNGAEPMGGDWDW